MTTMVFFFRYWRNKKVLAQVSSEQNEVLYKFLNFPDTHTQLPEVFDYDFVQEEDPIDDIEDSLHKKSEVKVEVDELDHNIDDNVEFFDESYNDVPEPDLDFKQEEENHEMDDELEPNVPSSMVETKIEEPISFKDQFVCLTCGTTFNSIVAINLHKKDIHNENIFGILRKTDDKIIAESYKLTMMTKKLARSYDIDMDESEENKHSIIKTNQSFQCKLCDETFASKTTLNSHIRSSCQAKPFKCKMCDKSFGTKKNLKSHITLIHAKPFKCKICDKSFGTKEYLKSHITLIHEGVERSKCFKCQQCGKDFYDLDNVNAHIRQVHRKWICFADNENFSNYKSFKKHLEEFHDGIETMNDKVPDHPGDKVQDLVRIYGDEDKVVCLICNGTFPNGYVTKRHLLEDHQNEFNDFTSKCKLCNDMVMKSHTILKSHFETTHKVDKDDENLDTRELLKMYKFLISVMDLCTGDTFSSWCKYCNLCFRRRKTFENHLKDNKFETLNCDYCDEAFESTCTYAIHYDQLHSLCKICDKKVPELNNHLILAHGIKNWKKFLGRNVDKEDWKDDPVQNIASEDMVENDTKEEIKVKDEVLNMEVEDDNYKCYFCNQTFASGEPLKNHFWDFHKMNVDVGP